MNDRELIKIIAEIWVANGGDSDGFLYSFLRIKNKIEEIERESEA